MPLKQAVRRCSNLDSGFKLFSAERPRRVVIDAPEEVDDAQAVLLHDFDEQFSRIGLVVVVAGLEAVEVHAVRHGRSVLDLQLARLLQLVVQTEEALVHDDVLP